MDTRPASDNPQHLPAPDLFAVRVLLPSHPRELSPVPFHPTPDVALPSSCQAAVALHRLFPPFPSPPVLQTWTNPFPADLFLSSNAAEGNSNAVSLLTRTWIISSASSLLRVTLSSCSTQQQQAAAQAWPNCLAQRGQQLGGHAGWVGAVGLGCEAGWWPGCQHFSLLAVPTSQRGQQCKPATQHISQGGWGCALGGWLGLHGWVEYGSSGLRPSTNTSHPSPGVPPTGNWATASGRWHSPCTCSVKLSNAQMLPLTMLPQSARA